MKEHFKIGDVVRLKSGGIKMTVISSEACLIECAYWNEIKGAISYTGNQPDSLFAATQ